MQQKQDRSRQLRRLYLTGFMGAGKSTVGPLLAERMRWRFIDLDSVIESEAGAPVSSIFVTHGEPYFRSLELDTIRSTQAESELVISLGGGAIETEEVRSILTSDPKGMLVFLDAPLDRLVERCTAQDGGESRPLLRNRRLLAFRFEKRQAYYQTAHLTVATQDRTPEEVAATIVESMAALTR